MFLVLQGWKKGGRLGGIYLGAIVYNRVFVMDIIVRVFGYGQRDIKISAICNNCPLQLLIEDLLAVHE